MLEENLPHDIYKHSPTTRFLIRYLALSVGFTIIAIMGFIPIHLLWRLANPNEAIEILSAVMNNKEFILPYLTLFLLLTTKRHLDAEHSNRQER